jgi:hypothetical protein
LARQQPPDLRDELFAWRETRHVDLSLGIVAPGDTLPSVERSLGEIGVGEHPELVGGDGIRYQVGHGGGRHAFVDGPLDVRGYHPGGHRRRGDLTQDLGPVAFGLVDAGANPARAQDADPDRKPRDLHRPVQVVGDGDHGVLGRVVGGTSTRDQAGGAGRVDDVALALRGQQRQEGPYPVDDSPQVDSEHPPPGGDRAEPRVGVAAHARVVAHHVHRAEPVNRSGRQGIHCCFVADIGGHGERLGSQGRHLLLGRLQRRFLDVGQNHIESGAGEALC